MIARLCASSLVLLILSPFTAPFSTCDLPLMLGHATMAREASRPSVRGHEISPHGPFAPAAPIAASANTSTSLVPLLPTTGRIRPIAVTGLRLSSVVVEARTRSPHAERASDLFQVHITRSTILRL